MSDFTTLEIEKLLNELFPFSSAEKWDNVGLQIANNNKKIKKILLTLDVTVEVLNYTVRNKFDLIISHHPIIFFPLKNIIGFNNLKHYIIKELLINDISFIALHTNLDKFLYYVLPKKINLKNIKVLEPNSLNPEIGLGSYGELEKEITFKELILLIKDKLNISVVRYAGNLKKKIKKVALCGGTGTSFISEELRTIGIDTFITADIKYHEFQKAIELNFNIIDAGHFYTEAIMLPELEKILRTKLGDKIYIETSKIKTDSIQFF